jgi:hypothetical protein
LTGVNVSGAIYFIVVSIKEDKKEPESPLENIKGIKTNIAMDEILEAIKQAREDREYKSTAPGAV